MEYLLCSANNFFLIYLFLAVLGLRFCARAFSSCGKRGPLFITVHGPLTIAASLVAEHRLQTRRLSNCGSRAGPVALWHVGSSQTRARTRVPCIGRQILNHCTTREARVLIILFHIVQRTKSATKNVAIKFLALMAASGVNYVSTKPGTVKS